VQAVGAEVQHWHEKEELHAAMLGISDHMPVEGLCDCGAGARILCVECGRQCVSCSSRAHRGDRIFHCRDVWLPVVETIGERKVTLLLKQYVRPGMEPVRKGESAFCRH